ncbi:MAG: hypothetical protein A4E47_01702 [Methanosaeta sp. PtaU1.Bin028]|nr:MAG: hypothetical protein A4E47_01702 [Methanosaeta sp. PtaU1.Bin028]
MSKLIPVSRKELILSSRSQDLKAHTREQLMFLFESLVWAGEQHNLPGPERSDLMVHRFLGRPYFSGNHSVSSC